MNMQVNIKDGVYSYVSQPQMQVEIILASKSPNQPTIYTIRMRYPRIIHGEIMTHRLFSRNARSSRAVPVKTMLLECASMPFVPWHWGKNQKGMQADEECNEPIQMWCQGIHFDNVTREEAWLEARDASVEVAKALMEAGYHKQIPNRLLEPFSWIDTLITSTDWDNFLWLRDHGDAEPHLIDLARLVKVAIEEAEVQDIMPGSWHQPYTTDDDFDEALALFDEFGDDAEEWLNKISAARCARISYKPFDGDASYERELERYDMLVSSDRVHASPTEHQATPDKRVEPHNPYEGRSYWEKSDLHGNFDGWIQARKLILNERYSAT